MESRVYFWPGGDVEIRGLRPTEHRPYDEAVPFEDRADAVAEWLVDAAESRSDDVGPGGGHVSFHALYLEEPDAQGHAHGPYSPQTDAAVRRVDEVLGRLREKTGESVWKATNVIVVADHGLATVSRDRVVYLGAGGCGVDFSKVAVVGGGIVLGVWGRSADGRKPSEEKSVGFDPGAMAELINACHPNVTAWVRSDLPERFKYKSNRRVAPVVVAADVGWTLCGHRSVVESGDADDNNTDPLDWALKRGHSGCGDTLCPEGGNTLRTCGAHGYDNEAPEMRALFLASGPAFRKDGVRLVSPTLNSSSQSVGGDLARDYVGDIAGAEYWETRTMAFDNVLVQGIVARALGIDLRAATLSDGGPPPAADATLSDDLAKLLFDDRARDVWQGRNELYSRLLTRVFSFFPTVIVQSRTHEVSVHRVNTV